MQPVARRTVLVAGAVVAGSAAVGGCTWRPGTSGPLLRAVGRPRAADWTALAGGLAGELIRPHDADYDSARRLYNPRFDQIRPAAVVEAANRHDVAESVRFAGRFGLLARPRSGGHSYVGVSTAAGGIVVDVGPIRGVDYDPASGTALVRAGSRLFDVHAALEPHGRSLPTGTCPTVGAAGLALGGGIGVEGRAHGLTCDAVQELTVVTADGRTVVVDAHHHPDLFWALRGGGGGNVGVVTAMRVRTFPAHRMGFYFITWSWSDAVAVITGWQRRVPRMPRSAWANLHLEASPSGSVAVRAVGVSLTGDGGDEAAALQAAVGRPATSVSTISRSHADGIKLLAGCSSLTDRQCHLSPRGTLTRESFAAGSDVLGAAMSQTVAADLVALVGHRASSGRSAAVIIDPLGGAVSDRRAGSTAFRWRRALATVQWYVGLADPPRNAEVAEAYTWIGSGHRVLAPASVGGYVNYLEPGRAVHSYYGANYARLHQVKGRYDPTGFFRSHFSV